MYLIISIIKYVFFVSLRFTLLASRWWFATALLVAEATLYASRHMLQSNVTCCALHALKRVVYSVSRDQVNDVSYVVAEISSFDALFFTFWTRRVQNLFFVVIVFLRRTLGCHSGILRGTYGEVPIRFQSGSNEVPMRFQWR